MSMNVRHRFRALPLVPLIVGALLVQSAAAQGGPYPKDPLDSSQASTKANDFSLFEGSKGLALTSKNPGQSTLWLPLTPGEWSLFKGMRPFATFSPSTLEPITRLEPGVATTLREPTSEDSWKGLGLGAGFQWRLTDRLDLFGQYHFISLPGANAPTGSPYMRRETESPGLKAGLTIHF